MIQNPIKEMLCLLFPAVNEIIGNVSPTSNRILRRLSGAIETARLGAQCQDGMTKALLEIQATLVNDGWLTGVPTHLSRLSGIIL